jgi:hypothetical protein
MTANQIIISALASILRAARPATLPENVQIGTEGDIEPATRPYIVFEAGDGQTSHPLMLRVDAKMTLHTRADETADEVAGGWMQAVTDTMAAHTSSLYSTILPHGWRLKKVRAANGVEGESPDRARYYSTDFAVWVERAI